MATILTQNKNSFRLWNTVVDQWQSPLMSAEMMINYLQDAEEHTDEEAINRVLRKGYTKKHLQWLNEFFDSQWDCLNKEHERNKL